MTSSNGRVGRLDMDGVYRGGYAHRGISKVLAFVDGARDGGVQIKVNFQVFGSDPAFQARSPTVNGLFYL